VEELEADYRKVEEERDLYLEDNTSLKDKDKLKMAEFAELEIKYESQIKNYQETI
jgi:hypothetical protein